MASQFPTCLKHHKLVVCKWPNDLHREMCETFSQMAQTCVQVSLKSSSHTFIHMQQTANVNKTQTKSAELSKGRVQVAGQAPRRNTGEKGVGASHNHLTLSQNAPRHRGKCLSGGLRRLGGLVGVVYLLMRATLMYPLPSSHQRNHLKHLLTSNSRVGLKYDVSRASEHWRMTKNDETHCWGYFFIGPPGSLKQKRCHRSARAQENYP